MTLLSGGGVSEGGTPDVTELETDVLGDGVVLVDLDGFSDPAWEPVSNGLKECCLVPVNAVV